MDNLELKQRIQDVINRKQFTSSKLADILGVQRSSVSHILSGRNNPSLDFVVRMVTKIEGLNINWLLFGDGEMFSQETRQDVSMQTLFDSVEKQKSLDDKSSASVRDANSESINKKQIAKILVFYTDSTFDEFKPNA